MNRIARSCFSSLLAVDSKGAAYFGGTAGFKEAKDPVEGTLDTKNETPLIFTATGKNFSGHVPVLELGKDIVRVTRPIVETRSGKKIECQDDEARKSAK